MLLLNSLIGVLAVGLTVAAPAPPLSPRAAGRPAAVSPATTDFQPQVAARAWNSIVLHHSATSAGSVASIDAVHRRKKDLSGKHWLGIGYHFVVGNGQKMADGEIQPTFRWLQQLSGAHAGKREYNEHGIGICLIGNFDETTPTARQLAAVRGLLDALARRYAIPPERILRHRDVQATLCPGRLFPWDQVTADLLADEKGS
jgi:N-acetylmuramoyl-L-alanine amidase-like protein